MEAAQDTFRRDKMKRLVKDVFEKVKCKRRENVISRARVIFFHCNRFFSFYFKLMLEANVVTKLNDLANGSMEDDFEQLVDMFADMPLDWKPEIPEIVETELERAFKESPESVHRLAILLCCNEAHRFDFLFTEQCFHFVFDETFKSLETFEESKPISLILQHLETVDRTQISKCIQSYPNLDHYFKLTVKTLRSKQNQHIDIPIHLCSLLFSYEFTSKPACIKNALRNIWITTFFHAFLSDLNQTQRAVNVLTLLCHCIDSCGDTVLSRGDFDELLQATISFIHSSLESEDCASLSFIQNVSRLLRRTGDISGRVQDQKIILRGVEAVLGNQNNWQWIDDKLFFDIITLFLLISKSLKLEIDFTMCFKENQDRLHYIAQSIYEAEEHEKVADALCFLKLAQISLLKVSGHLVEKRKRQDGLMEAMREGIQSMRIGGGDAYVNELKSICKTKDAVMESQKRRIEFLEGKREESEYLIKVSGEEVKEYREKVTVLIGKYERSVDENAMLASKVKALTKEKKEAKESMDKEISMKDSVLAENAKLRSKVDLNETEAKLRASYIIGLVDAFESKSEELSESKVAVEKLQLERNAFNQKLNLLEEQNSALQKQLNLLETQLEMVQCELDETNLSNSALGQKLQSVQSLYTASTSRVDRLEAELSASQTEAASKTDQIKLLQHRLTKYQEMADILHSLKKDENTQKL